jgi:hypothetical protein
VEAGHLAGGEAVLGDPSAISSAKTSRSSARVSE